MAGQVAGRAVRDAWRQIVVDNPLPAVHGRVCYHPCEDTCNREDVDSPVCIHAIERFLGDMAIENGWTVRSSGDLDGQAGADRRRGAERALRRLAPRAPRSRGRDPRRWAPMAGGMMRFGIPTYRLPREVLDAEIRRIEALGVDDRAEPPASRIWSPRRQTGRFDAVFVAVGAHLAKRVGHPRAATPGKIFDAVAFLRSVAEGERPRIGRRVAVYGGGNTAMDAARVAKRLGAEEAMIVYRRTREQMPAHAEEAEDAEREGVRINWLRTITAIDGPELQIEVMELDDRTAVHSRRARSRRSPPTPSFSRSARRPTRRF